MVSYAFGIYKQSLDHLRTQLILNRNVAKVASFSILRPKIFSIHYLYCTSLCENGIPLMN